MSNHEAIVFDDRARAFVQSRELIEKAQAIRAEWTGDVAEDDPGPDELPAEYWAAVAEAAVLAQLAASDPAVGYLAGAHMVQRKDRRDHRREARQRVTRALDDRRALRGEATRGTNDVAPWREGMEVRLTEGDYAGRRGQVYTLELDATPPQITVELAPPGRPDDPSEPIVLTVLPSQIELVVE